MRYLLALALSWFDGSPAAAVAPMRDVGMQCMAIAAFGEARNQSDRGVALVVKTVLNRMRRTGLPPCTITYRSYEGFRAWHDRRPWEDNPAAWDRIMQITQMVIAGEIDFGPCETSTHFLNPRQLRRWPSWAARSNITCRVGDHIAFNVPKL